MLKAWHAKANLRVRKTHDPGALADVVAAHFHDMAVLAAGMEAWTDWSIHYRDPDESGAQPDSSRRELDDAASCIEQLAAALRARAPL